jgi:hypothetical protein
VATCNALKVSEVQAGAKTLDLEVVIQKIRRPDDLMPAFEALRVAPRYSMSPLTRSRANRVRINYLALGARMPTEHRFR